MPAKNSDLDLAPDYDAASGVPIDAIIFGGRTRDREPLIRAIHDLAEGGVLAQRRRRPRQR